MNLLGEFKRDKETVKKLKGKEKAAYIWQYYKWYIIVPVVLLIMVGDVVYHSFVDPDVIMRGFVVNAYGTDSEQLILDFANSYMEESDMDTKEETIVLDFGFSYIPDDPTGTANYETISALGAFVEAESLDVIFADTDSMEELAEADYFLNLSGVFTAKEMMKYSSYMVYVEGSPVLIDVSSNEELSKIFLEQYDSLAVGIARGAQHTKEAKEFIDYLVK